MSKQLDTVMRDLYNSEINCSVSCFWDGGWTVKIGDFINGFQAEATIDNSDFWGLEAARWLDTKARQLYPGSDYVKGVPLNG